MRDIDTEEGSAAAEERLESWSKELLCDGYPKEQVAAVLSSEWYLRDFAGAYRQDKLASGSTKSLGEWATRQMTTTDFHHILSFDELEARVRALSRLAGLSYDEATKSIVRIWTAGSPGPSGQSRSPAAVAPEN
jgi:hypothetical protein